MTRFPIALAVSLLLMLFAEQACAEGKRVALVVGVGAYQSVPTLPNAVNDSGAMADLFRKAGFDVVTARSDVGNLDFKRAIREFEDSVADADIAVVYYAGHGIEVRDQNYLIPTDAKLANERDVEDEAIALDRVITALEPAKRLRLIILDACRDNPFAGKMKRRLATRAVTAGLGKVEPQMSDTLIAYAAKDKSVANDGTGPHSPFTTALLDNITVPGLDIRLAFGRVRDEVLKTTGHQQEPFVYGSLGGGTVALVPAPVAVASTAAPQVSDVALAKSDYELVERVGKKEAWEVFLNTHKTGMYADLARVQLAKLTPANAIARNDTQDTPLEGKPRYAPPVEAPSVAPEPKPTAEERKAWDKLKSSADQGAIRKFIEKYPSSPLVSAAQERLETLERLAKEREDAARIEREAAKQRDDEERQRKAAEAERKAIEREAARHRAEEEKAKAAELARQKAEELAAAKQKEAEERAKAAEARAKQREEEERARAAAIAERKREAEEKAKIAEAERQKALAEAAERKRQQDEAAKAVAAEKASREAAEKAKAAEIAAQKKQAEDEAKAAKAAEARKQAEEKAEEQAKAAQTAAEKKDADDKARAAEAAAKRLAEEQAKAAEAAAKKQAAEEKAKAAAAAAEQRKAEEKAKAADVAEQKKKAEESAKAAEAERQNAKAAAAAKKREDDELKAAETRRDRARAEADEERRKAAAAAKDAAERQAERAAAAKRREAAESARAASEEAAASRRKAAAEASRKASEKQAERAAAAAEQRRRAAAEKAAARPAPKTRPVAQAAPRAPAPARPVARASSGGGGGGAAPMVGIGF